MLSGVDADTEKLGGFVLGREKCRNFGIFSWTASVSFAILANTIAFGSLSGGGGENSG
jgi:hypothetical protein